MKTSKKKRALSLEEGAEMLGAEKAEEIGPFRMDPIGMRVMATKIAARLVSRGGRPTDKTWDIDRKIPMKSATWRRLKDIAEALAKQDVRAAPGQLAAIALEKGLPTLTKENGEPIAPSPSWAGPARYEPQEKSEEEAKVLCGVINEQGLW